MVDNSGTSWRDRSLYALLTRHFFGRFFDNEFLSPGGEMVLSVTQILALLPVPGAVLSLYYIFMKYAFLIVKVHSWSAVDSWSDRCFFVSLSMIVTGLVTLLYWDNLFPDRKDYLNLVPLPVTLRTLFLAKVTSLVLFMGLFSVTVNAASGILFPLAATMSHATSADSARFLAAHFVSVVSGSAFVFLLLVAVQGACMTLLSRRLYRRVSVVIQSSLLVLLLSSFLVLSDLIVAVRDSQNPIYQHLFIPAWFTALYDRILGITRVHATAVAWDTAGIGLATVFALAVAFYAISYRRYLGQFHEAQDAGNGLNVMGRLVHSLRRTAGREPEGAAAFDFVTATLSRSPRHRMVLGSSLGVALAFCLAGVFILITREGGAGLHRVSLTLLNVPSILCFFLLCGVRFSFTIPSELTANWIFRTGVFRPDVYWRGVRAAIWTVILVPVFLLTVGLFTFFWGWSSAWRFSLIEALAAVILMERLFLDFPKMPFTCSYLPGKADLKLRWPVYVLSFGCYVVFTGIFCVFLQPRPRAYWVAVTIGILAVARLVHNRQQGLRTSTPIFDEQPGTEITTLFSRSPRASLRLCRE
ncbi:MAG: hypothetical protein EHM23_22210 [Acidobacteria bacterium]|nr:MAG: hypothetical protein EHM23_22210 [Acidobacteriota bacterium]